MPLYEFVCPQCGQRETFLTPLDHRDDPQTCPNECVEALDGVVRLVQMERVISAPSGFIGADSWRRG